MVTPMRWVIEPGTTAPKIVHVNAAATGGGVAELLHSLVPAQGAARAVISGSAPFFDFTKRLHNLLHGRGDPRITSEEARLYHAVLEPQARWLAEQVGPGDAVILHDPQTLGMAPVLAETSAAVLWHCHIGTMADRAGPAAVWRCFAEELDRVAAVITTRAEFVPHPRRHLVAPAIDLDAPKNRPLSPAEVDRLLIATGLYPGGADDAIVHQDQPLPPTARLVVQVSRWDPLKDMVGALRCLTDLPPDVHMALVGQEPDEIPDDPEGRVVLRDVREARQALPPAVRERTHLVRLSLRRPAHNALLVNAVQRRADVVLQKSFEEGFGLTVTEAMAKGKAVVAGDVGGLRLQITHGETGLLVDPTDDAATAGALRRLLDDADLRHRLGERARRAAARYTMPTMIDAYRRVLAEVGAGTTRETPGALA
jgi:trehalose synthase